MLSVIIDNREYSLDDGAYGHLIAHDGWGMPVSTRVASQGPLQHGDTDEGQFLEPRIGNLVFRVNNPNLDSFYDAREPFMELFHPNNSPRLKFSMNKGIRVFECFFLDGISMPWQPGSWGNLRVVVTLKCPDPSCYDPVVRTLTFTSGSGGGFEIPLMVPISVGGSTIEDVHNIQYEGTWIEYPKITIVGPIEDVTLINEATDEVLDFTGLSLGSGEQRIVDTRYGFKTVVDGSGVNKIADLVADSDLATFHLEHKRIYETSRSNPIAVTGTGSDSNTKVIIRYLERYLGI